MDKKELVELIYEELIDLEEKELEYITIFIKSYKEAKKEKK